jgi:hypothetical protein
MTKQIYAIVKYFPEDEPTKNACDQVYLELSPENEFQGKFEFFTEFYSSDWGDRVKKVVGYLGTYQEDGEKITCQSQHKYTFDGLNDHEMQTHEQDEKTIFCTEVFIFAKSDDEILCPIDGKFLSQDIVERFKGKAMKKDVEIYKSDFWKKYTKGVKIPKN